GRAGAHAGTDGDFGHVAHAQRRAAAGKLERQIGDVGHGLHATDGAHGHAFAAEFDDRSAGIARVGGNRVGDVAEREADGNEFGGIGRDDELPIITTGSVDLGYALDRAQRGFDDVVLHEFEFAQFFD